jgi:hypothetical protein
MHTHCLRPYLVSWKGLPPALAASTPPSLITYTVSDRAPSRSTISPSLGNRGNRGNRGSGGSGGSAMVVLVIVMIGHRS